MTATVGSEKRHQLLEKEHPDITYLKQDEIGLVLAKALNETYQRQPTNPIEFFAKWLLNHSRTAKKAHLVASLLFSLFSTANGKSRSGICARSTGISHSNKQPW